MLACISTSNKEGFLLTYSHLQTLDTYNPAEERARYNGDTDTEMTMLKFVADDEEQTPLGMVNWYAVHGTAMNNTNKLVSGDNKGLASYLFEKKMNGEGVLAGEGDFVAAFAATNLGDVSPNTNGSFCVDTGLPCEMTHSTCNGKNELCQGRGPGKDMFESTEIIAKKQFETAERLWEDADGGSEEENGDGEVRSSSNC